MEEAAVVASGFDESQALTSTSSSMGVRIVVLARCPRSWMSVKARGRRVTRDVPVGTGIIVGFIHLDRL